MDAAELTHRIIAASGPPAVDDLTTFLRKRVAEDRRTLDSAPAGAAPGQFRLGIINVGDATAALVPLKRFAAHLDAIEATLDKFQTALSQALRSEELGWGHSVAYMDVIKIQALEYATHPDYKESWRP